MKYDEIFVKAPFSPVDLVCENNEAEFKLWGRSYKMDNHSPLFASVISQDEEILASPIRIVMEENGAPSNWCDTKIIPLDEEDPSSKTLLATTASDAFYINTSTTVEFDGFTKVQLKVMPRGLSVKEIFLARENKREVKFELDKLWVEIPVKKSSAIFYQVYPRCAVKNSKGETVKENSPLSTGDSVHKGTACFPFCAQFFVSGEKSGIGIVSENAKNWQSVSKDRVIECVDEGEVVLIRIRLLDSHPASWVHRGMSDVNCFTPLSFSFGFQVTPVKQFPKNPYIERNVHIDCFKKIEGDYEKYLSQEFIKDDGTKTGENGFDRLKRLGVNTLYLHEKWNDIQNSTLLTKASADRLSFIVDECHKRNIKVIPYFGYEISSLSPEWGERMEEICVKTKDGIAKGMWNRVPYQRCVHVCCNSSVLESFPRGIGALMDRFGFDGVYLDGTATPWDCANTDHGCGYIDQEGKLRPGYPVWAARDMLMAIYKVVHSRGGTINYHTAGSYNLSSLSLCDSIWEGEVTQFAFLNDTIALQVTIFPFRLEQAQKNIDFHHKICYNYKCIIYSMLEVYYV
jgi:hypothetical protein